MTAEMDTVNLPFFQGRSLLQLLKEAGTGYYVRVKPVGISFIVRWFGGSELIYKPDGYRGNLN